MAYSATAQAIKSTAPKYLPGYVDHTIRQRFLLAYLQKAGRFMFNVGGRDCTWNVKIRQPEIRSVNGQRSQFINSDVHEQLTITHAHLEGTDAIDRNTMMVNKGDQAIVNLTQEKLDDLVTSLADTMCAQVYVDNTSDTNQLTGLQTLMNPDVGANTDRVAVPAAGSTYGGKSMVLGAEGGSWTSTLAAARMNTAQLTDWPQGTGDPQFDFLSPKMFNYTGSWSSGTNTWEVNCEKIMSRARVAIKALSGEGTAPALHMLSTELYNQLQDNLRIRERLKPSDYASKLGFEDTLSYEGAIVTYDYECPPNKGYAINPMEMSLYSVHDQLMYVDGPDWDIKEQAYLFLVGFFGNLRFNPKCFAEYGSYTA